MAAAEKSERSGQADSDHGYYVYGIVPQDVEVDEGARGVGDPPARVKVVRKGDLAALVSEIDLSKPLGRPEDLMAHQQLLDATAPDAPVLPLKFGAVLTDADAVAEELLGANHDEFAAALDEMEGRVQYVVKGRYDEGAVLREVVSDNREAAELRDQIREQGDEDATRDLRIQLGEIINEAVTAKREEDTRAVGDALEGLVAASAVREPSHELDAVNVAVLVETAKQDDLERAVSDLGKQWEGRVEMRLLGPMAPYDFVMTGAPES